MKTLTNKNIKIDKIIINKNHPEWGTWRILKEFVGENGATLYGAWEIRGDAGDRMLFDNEFHFWRFAH